ncbi:hypothetical protein FRB94_001781 [Tulasnella sp. JGI-2019a]|nr:hypothetical protein FRB93_003800 [Tulasnella sp. JGI-2019a]KAG9005164.1 hypothetical protein FRB94_001781 [Tulasnella sp. JGI-2019a]
MIDPFGEPTDSIRSVFDAHRQRRDEQQRTLLLSQHNVQPDILLSRILHTNDWSLDQRYNLSFVIRPPPHIISLVNSFQERLLTLAGDSIWCPEPHALHMTIYEVTHSRTSDDLELYLNRIRQHREGLFDLPFDKVTLDAPLVNFDASAVAFSFLPLDSPYSYQHLRSDVFQRLSKIGVTWEGRYILPSAHITIARFISTDFLQATTMQKWVELIDQLSAECEDSKETWNLGEGIAEISTGRSWYGHGPGWYTV